MFLIHNAISKNNSTKKYAEGGELNEQQLAHLSELYMSYSGDSTARSCEVLSEVLDSQGVPKHKQLAVKKMYAANKNSDKTIERQARDAAEFASRVSKEEYDNFSKYVKKQLANEAEESPSEDGLKAPKITSNIEAFVPKGQLAAMRANKEISEQVKSLDETIENMPQTYGQDGKGREAIVYLHYFTGGSDFFITEKDMGSGDDKAQTQAFGLTSMPPNYPELGYINIEELKGIGGMEIDLYWKPKTIAEVVKEFSLQYKQGGELDVVTLTQKDSERLDFLQKREDQDILTPSENKEYEDLVKKYRRTKEYQANNQSNVETEYEVSLQNPESGDIEKVNVLAKSKSSAEDVAINESGLQGWEINGVKELKRKGGSTDMSYRLVDGFDHYNSKPLYQVVGVDNEYVGEWTKSKETAQKELAALEAKSSKSSKHTAKDLKKDLTYTFNEVYHDFAQDHSEIVSSTKDMYKTLMGKKHKGVFGTGWDKLKKAWDEMITASEKADQKTVDSMYDQYGETLKFRYDDSHKDGGEANAEVPKGIQEAVNEEIGSYTNRGILIGDATKKLRKSYKEAIADSDDEQYKKEYRLAIQHLDSIDSDLKEISEAINSGDKKKISAANKKYGSEYNGIYKKGGQLAGRRVVYKDDKIYVEHNLVSDTYSIRDTKTKRFLKAGGEVKTCQDGTQVQTLLLSKERFSSPKKAQKWAQKNGFKKSGYTENENTVRIRQNSPNTFRKNSFKTITLTEGVKAVIACPKEFKAEKGGEIPNNYDGKTPAKIWESWNIKQRVHFLRDHVYINKSTDKYVSNIAGLPYTHKRITKKVKNALEKHVKEGQYKEGGDTK